MTQYGTDLECEESTYRAAWYTRAELAYIAKELRAKEGAPRRCYGTLLQDVDSSGKRCGGGYGANIEKKARQLGFEHRDVLRALQIAKLH